MKQTCSKCVSFQADAKVKVSCQICQTFKIKQPSMWKITTSKSEKEFRKLYDAVNLEVFDIPNK